MLRTETGHKAVASVDAALALGATSWIGDGARAEDAVVRTRAGAPVVRCQLAAVLSQSMATCEIGVVVVIDATISCPDRAATLHQEAETLCFEQTGLPIES